MEFVQNFAPPEFQAETFTLSISPNLNSFSDKNTKKWTNLHCWQKFYTAAGSDGIDKSHLCIKVWALSSRWGVLAASIKLWQLSYFSYAHLTFSLATHIYETLPRGVGHFKMPKVPLEILSSPLLFCNWKVLDTGHKGYTKTKTILFEVAPITKAVLFEVAPQQRLSYFKDGSFETPVLLDIC